MSARISCESVLFVMRLWFPCFLLVFSLQLGGSHSVSSPGNLTSNRDCVHQRCHHVSVPYPFTLHGSSCPSHKLSADDANFTLNCTSEGVLYLGNYTEPVLSISNDSLIINQVNFKSHYHVNERGSCNVNTPPLNWSRLRLPDGGPFVAAGDNQFGSFGCSAGYLYTTQSEHPSAYDAVGCEPMCGLTNASNFPKNNTCGPHPSCCVSNFPMYSRTTYYLLEALSEDPSPCTSFAVPFHPSHTNFTTTYGVKVTWALHDPKLLTQLKSLNRSAHPFNVSDLSENISTACTRDNSSQLTIVDEVPGYRCACLSGYKGDGYAQGTGCTDIDECNTNASSCVHGRTKCRNTNGSYTCHCKSRWHVGDGMSNGTGCSLSAALIKVISVTGDLMGLIMLLVIVVGANVLLDRRRKRLYFKLNGGVELQSFIAMGTGRQFFTTEELKEATHNFSEHLKLGIGGFGTVYRGTLKDGREVAIKKANRLGDGDRSQFLNELAILTQINHKHIVRLHGCCLETVNPLLVYEFVSNGNLEDHLASEIAMGWAKRLQVATQVADALAYLHAAASPPILHRDVKTANILLDGNFNAKVADFGISRLIPEGEKCVSTVVQGTLGYLDPEYFQTLQLTDTSDVYSLGVVLVELITGLRAVDNRRRDVKFANLALLFMDRMKEERLQELMDERLYKDLNGVDAQWKLSTSVRNVAKVTQRCLALRGVERPCMNELAHTLHQVTAAFEHPAQLGQDEADMLRPLVSAFLDDVYNKTAC